MHRTALLILGLLALLVASGGRPAHGAEIEEGATTVRWDGGLDHLGREAISLLPTIRRQVEERLGWATDGHAEVVIVASLGRMREEARAKVPAWAVGVALSGDGRIVIRADLLAAGHGSSLESVLRHEWVHVAWGRRSGGNRRLLPLWAEEGIAEDLGGGISVDAGAALDVAVAFDRLLAFQDIETSFPEEARGADLAYKQSRSLIQYVAGSAGWAPIREVLADLADWSSSSPTPRETAFGERIRARTGLSVGEWAAAWRQSLAKDARPWFHLLLHDFSGLLLMILAGIGVGAFWIIARRRRREIDRLPDGGPPFQGPEDDPRPPFSREE